MLKIKKIKWWDKSTPCHWYWLIFIGINALFISVFKHNYWFLFFSVPALLIGILLNLRSWKFLIIWTVILTMVFLLFLFVPQIYNIKHTANIWWVRKQMMNYIKSSYNKQSTNFIFMLLFGVKNYHSELSQKINFLNLAQLFVVSGLHLQLLHTVLNKIFIHHQKIATGISLSLLLIICYMTRFSISCVRVLTLSLLQLSPRFKQYDNLQKTSINALILLCLNPIKACSFSFIMVHIALFTINIIHLLISHKWIKHLLINILVYLSLLPIVINFNGLTNLLSLFLSFIFSPIILFVYYLTLFFVWIPNFVVINWIIQSLLKLIDITFSYQPYWYFSIPTYGQIIFYLCWLVMLLWGYYHWHKKLDSSIFTHISFNRFNHL